MRLAIDQRLSRDPEALVKRLSDILTDIARQLNGLTEGRISVHHEALAAPPTAGSWAQGDFVRNSAPVNSGGSTIYGWLCVAGGTPGTWLPIGGGGGTGTVTSVAATVPSFLSVSGSPVTTTGTLAIGYSGTALPIANGGTAGTTASAARTALGLAIGTDVQAFDTDLSDLAGLSRTHGDVIYGGSSAWTRLGAGTKRRVLTTRGASANPDWGGMDVTAIATVAYTLVDTDVGNWLNIDAATTAIATLSTASGYAVGESTIFRQNGAGQLQVAAGSGVKVLPTTPKARAQHSVIAATRIANEGSGTLVFSVYGDLL